MSLSKIRKTSVNKHGKVVVMENSFRENPSLNKDDEVKSVTLSNEQELFMDFSSIRKLARCMKISSYIFFLE